MFQKKALTTLKAPKSEPEPPPVVTRKRPLEGKDAKEIAKKLLSSGKIKAIPKPGGTFAINWERRNLDFLILFFMGLISAEKTTFKRSLGLERKLSGVEHRIGRSSGLSSPPYMTPRPNNAPPLPPLDSGTSPTVPTPPRPVARANRNRKKVGKREANFMLTTLLIWGISPTIGCPPTFHFKFDQTLETFYFTKTYKNSTYTYSSLRIHNK